LFARNRSAIARLGVLSRHSARVRRRGEPDPIDALVPDKELNYLRDEIFVKHPDLSKADKLEAMSQTLPGYPPLLSVLIPYFDEDIYFFEKYLAHLSRQTFRNFEVVVHDDGSRNLLSETGIRQLLPETAVRLTRSSQHQGPAHSREELLSQARGSIVMWQNQDIHGSDWIRPEADHSVNQRRSVSVVDFVANRI
jgi:hypothetical protein